MSIEHTTVEIFPAGRAATQAAADRVAALIRAKADAGRPAVLGLAAGHAPADLYAELVRLHREDGLDFTHVVVFTAYEHWPIDRDAPHSAGAWMRRNLLEHVNIPPGNVHRLDGSVAEAQLQAHCRRHEQAIADAGGIDIQVLGVGLNGRIALNEPGAPPDSRTRRVRLERITRKDAAADFFGEENVPETGLTIGLATIRDAREVCVLAAGEQEAPVVRAAVEGDVSDPLPASRLQGHPNATWYVDEAAAADLTRLAAPWVLGPCQWDDRLARQAVIWLARRLGKPILKLTDEDYAENHLGELRSRSGVYETNLAAFGHLMGTVTARPAGEEARRIIVFSPHPDDDVICMGATMMRLIEQGHEVHVAYMVSGASSVFDHDVARYADFVREFNAIFGVTAEHLAPIEGSIESFLRGKRPGDADSSEVRAVKGLIRRTEALDAARFCGLDESHIHFLNMPLYDAGGTGGAAVGDDDVAAVRGLLERVRPEVLFAAGDLSDPHGTHRLCEEAGLAALREYVAAGNPRPDLWLYRGAWQEWAPEQIDRAVPLSPAELRRKRYAIFRHQSQKDRAMFPGPVDNREFWQRAEQRNIATAELYDALGLPEYHALEAFVRWPLQQPANAAFQMSGRAEATRPPP